MSSGIASLNYPAWWRLLGLLLVAAVIAGSLLPPSDIPSLHVNDKIQHIAAYALLMYWFVPISSRRVHIVVAVLLLALGVAVEFLQRASAYRDFEFGDMVADGVGVLAGWFLAWTPAGRILPALDRRFARWIGRG